MDRSSKQCNPASSARAVSNTSLTIRGADTCEPIIVLAAQEHTTSRVVQFLAEFASIAATHCQDRQARQWLLDATAKAFNAQCVLERYEQTSRRETPG
jgi:hypothetical protein